MQQYSSGFYVTDIHNQPGINNYAVNAAWVSDNALWGYVGPISGRLLAQMICGERTDLDPAPFDPRRFSAGPVSGSRSPAGRSGG